MSRDKNIFKKIGWIHKKELISSYSVHCRAGQSSHTVGDVFNWQSLNLLKMRRVLACQGTQLILWFRLSSCLFPPRMQPFYMALEWCTSTIMHFSGKYNSVSSSNVRSHTCRSARITHHFIIFLYCLFICFTSDEKSQLRLSLCFHGNSTTREPQLWLNLKKKKTSTCKHQQLQLLFLMTAVGLSLIILFGRLLFL